MRISLRELLIGVALVALAIVSLRYANYGTVWPAVVTGVMMIALFVALIVAAVDRGPRQAFAIGFALTVVAYGLMLLPGRTSQFDQSEGWLPTTRLLWYVHRAVDRGRYYVAQFPTVQKGENDAATEVLKNLLNAKLNPSPNMQVDSGFGARTEARVKQFQSQAGLPVTGVVDNATWIALGPIIDEKSGQVLAAYAPKTPGALGSAGGPTPIFIHDQLL
jgi:peptidoglycan hydrolase-like protein with peptidoglycan-binding domain